MSFSEFSRWRSRRRLFPLSGRALADRRSARSEAQAPRIARNIIDTAAWVLRYSSVSAARYAGFSAPRPGILLRCAIEAVPESAEDANAQAATEGNLCSGGRWRASCLHAARPERSSVADDTTEETTAEPLAGLEHVFRFRTPIVLVLHAIGTIRRQPPSCSTLTLESPGDGFAGALGLGERPTSR